MTKHERLCQCPYYEFCIVRGAVEGLGYSCSEIIKRCRHYEKINKRKLRSIQDFKWAVEHPGHIFLRPKRTVYIRICKHCGKEFKTNHIHQKFCSRTCGYAERPGRPTIRQPIERECKYCGKKFFQHDHYERVARFCSRLCGGKYIGKVHKRHSVTENHEILP